MKGTIEILPPNTATMGTFPWHQSWIVMKFQARLSTMDWAWVVIRVTRPCWDRNLGDKVGQCFKMNPSPQQGVTPLPSWTPRCPIPCEMSLFDQGADYPRTGEKAPTALGGPQVKQHKGRLITLFWRFTCPQGYGIIRYRCWCVVPLLACHCCRF